MHPEKIKHEFSYFSSVLFQSFKRLLYEVSKVDLATLCKIYLVTHVLVLVLEDVQHRQDLPVVRNHRLTNRLCAHDQSLDDLQGNGDNVRITRIQSRCKIITLAYF